MNSLLIKLGQYLPVLQSTGLGWIVSGSIPRSRGNYIRENNKAVCGLTLDVLNFELEHFWEIEETLPKQNRPEKQKCKDIFSWRLIGKCGQTSRRNEAEIR